jgi:thiamine biosynthesis lipoprotein
MTGSRSSIMPRADVVTATTSPPGPAGGLVERSLTFGTMGGSATLRVACAASAAEPAERRLAGVARRIDAWAARLTRFDPSSDLACLNRDPGRDRVRVGPTLYAVLEHAMGLRDRTEGRVDAGLLDERLAAEHGLTGGVPTGDWWLTGPRRDRLVARAGSVRFDLDGVAKGWIADRALRLLWRYPAAMVDADGDIAMRVGPSTGWRVAVADPRRAAADVACLSLPRGWPPRAIGIATSGTSVHRWQGSDGIRHHLIDPLTGRPAVTDVVQATAVAESAAVAEGLAKAALIAGSDEALDLGERAGAWALLLLLDDGQLVATPRSLEWMS